ncbi:MAG: PAS domain-containing protein [Ignavibacteriales bacterium]|nr:PAS domain-containing protein [Ignavibacteriales bacterium]
MIFPRIVFTAILASFVPFSAMGGGDDAPVSVRLQLKWYHQFQFAGFYVALDKGYYADEGLEVEILEGGPGHDPVADVAEGRAEFGVHSASETIDAVLDGMDFLFVASVFQHNPSVLIARADADYEALEDFIGEKVLIVESSRRYLTRTLFEANGIPIDSIELVEDVPYGVEPLIDGRIAALGGYISTEPELMRELGVEPRIFNPHEYGRHSYGDVLFTTRQFYEDEYETVAAFRRASMKGWEYAFDNVDETVEIIRRLESRRETRSRDLLIKEARALRILVMPDLLEIGTLSARRLWDTGKYTKDPERAAQLDYQKMIFDPRYQERFYEWAIYIAVAHAVVGLVFVGMFVWNRTLTRRVREKTRELRREVEERAASEKRLVESERFATKVMETTPDLVYIFDFVEGKNVYANRQLGAVLGYSREEIAALGDRFIAKLIHPEDLARTIEFNMKMTSADDEEIRRHQYRILHADGTYRWLEGYNRVFLRDEKGSVKQIIGTTKDVTDLTRASERLENYAAELRESNDFKDKLFSIIAHDLRSPFNSLIGLATILESIDPAANPDRVRRHASEIASQSKRVFGLLENLLHWSRAQSDRIEFSPEETDVVKAIESATRIFRSEFARKSVSFTTSIEEGLTARADPAMLDGVLRNLVSNAVKYTPTGGTIEATAARRDGVVEIRVRDTGVGMERAVAARLFDGSKNVSTRGLENESGAGLGLAICKEFVERHGGRIDVESEPGRGALFRFTLPDA